MPIRRSARVRAVNALQTITNETQDENNMPNSQRRDAGKRAVPARKEKDRLRKASETKTPFRDVTNVRTTRSRHPRKTVGKPGKLTGDNSDINNDDVVTTAPGKRVTRRSLWQSKASAASEENRPADEPRKEAEPADAEERSTPEIQPATALDVPHSRRDDDCIRSSSPREEREVRTQIETGQNELPHDSSTDEIQPNLPKTVFRIEEPESEPSSDEIQPNSPANKRRMPSILSESSDEIRPEPPRNERPSASLRDESGVRSPSAATNSSPPLSPLSPKPSRDAQQDSWLIKNRDAGSAELDTTRPRQAVYTYGKRRRVARVSLPTMQALGVRTKSPSSESQSSSEKDDDEDGSDAAADSDDESEETPKRNPGLQKFVTEQKKLWDEVDQMDLLVESD